MSRWPIPAWISTKRTGWPATAIGCVGNSKEKIKRVASKLPFAEDLLAAFYCAFDAQTPRHVQAALLGALAYFVMPFDLVPDMLPLLGFGDDAAVLVTALKMVSSHIRPEHRDAARAKLADLAEGGEIV